MFAPDDCTSKYSFFYFTDASNWLINFLFGNSENNRIFVTSKKNTTKLL